MQQEVQVGSSSPQDKLLYRKVYPSRNHAMVHASNHRQLQVHPQEVTDTLGRVSVVPYNLHLKCQYELTAEDWLTRHRLPNERPESDSIQSGLTIVSQM